MRRRLAPLAVLAVLAAELAAFVVVGNLLGFGLVVLLVVLVSLVGMVLLRREGLRAWQGFQRSAATGSPPGPQVTDGLVGLGGALLLAVPGLVTGLAGALLLVPPLRAVARGRVQARAERRMTSAAAGEVFGPRRVWAEQDHHPSGTVAEVVEGEVVDDRERPGPP